MSIPQIPILILTARAALKDRLKGFELGADDYLIKPFHLEELLMRVKVMLKRKQWYLKSVENMPIFRLGKSEINFVKTDNPFRSKHLPSYCHRSQSVKVPDRPPWESGIQA